MNRTSLLLIRLPTLPGNNPRELEDLIYFVRSSLIGFACVHFRCGRRALELFCESLSISSFSCTLLEQSSSPRKSINKREQEKFLAWSSGYEDSCRALHQFPSSTSIYEIQIATILFPYDFLCAMELSARQRTDSVWVPRCAAHEPYFMLHRVKRSSSVVGKQFAITKAQAIMSRHLLDVTKFKATKKRSMPAY